MPVPRRDAATGAGPHAGGDHGRARASEFAMLGLDTRPPRGSVARLARAVVDDPDPTVRASALSALVRRGSPSTALAPWRRAAADPAVAVRRRAAEIAPTLGATVPRARLRELLTDPDPGVAEAAAWAIGEHPRAGTREVRSLAAATTGHADPLVREAAVAAIGAIGDPTGLPAVLAAATDRPAIRRRAVLALAPFSGAAVDTALDRAASDRDWQVRDAARLLRGTPSGPDVPSVSGAPDSP